jgi:hypothetical protein
MVPLNLLVKYWVPMMPSPMVDSMDDEMVLVLDPVDRLGQKRFSLVDDWVAN